MIGTLYFSVHLLRKKNSIMKKTTLALTIFGVIGLGLTQSAMAAGFQIAEYSATGLGRAFAGEAAIADNASTQFRNPAMMTYLSGTNLSVGTIYIAPRIDVHGTSHGVSSQANNMASSATIPNFYFTHQLNDKWTMGLAIATAYGMQTNLKNYQFSEFGNQAKVHTIEFNPNIAYQINHQFSIGAGVRYLTANGHFGAEFPKHGPMAIYVEGRDSHAWGWQAGAAWQINANNRLGLNYRSAVNLNLNGKVVALNPMNPSSMQDITVPGSLPLTLPQTVELAGVHIINSQWAVSASMNWTNWSHFKDLEANIPALGGNHLIKEEQWRNNYRIALGTTYKVTSALTLRSGVAFDSSAVNSAHRTQTIPETNRLWLSMGAGYQFTPNFSVDTGLTYIKAQTANFVEQNPNFGTLNGTVSGHIWLVGLQANYKF